MEVVYFSFLSHAGLDYEISIYRWDGGVGHFEGFQDGSEGESAALGELLDGGEETCEVLAFFLHFLDNHLPLQTISIDLRLQPSCTTSTTLPTPTNWRFILRLHHSSSFYRFSSLFAKHIIYKGENALISCAYMDFIE